MKTKTYSAILHEWTKEDSKAAHALGWGLFEVWDGRMTLEIQKIDELNTFKTDDAAREHVEAFRARSPLHQKAYLLSFHSKVGKGKK